MVHNRHDDSAGELSRALLTAASRRSAPLGGTPPQPTRSHRPAWKNHTRQLARRAATPPPRKWATEQNLSVSKELVPTSPVNPLVRQPPSGTEMERRWQLNELKRQVWIPHAWAGGTALAGTAGWGMATLMEVTVSASAATTTGLVMGGAMAAGSAIGGLVKRRELGPHAARYAAAGAASSAWIATASLTGLSWWQLALLGITDVALGAGFWRSLRRKRTAIRNWKPAPPAPAPVLQPTPEPVLEPDEGQAFADEIAYRWVKYVRDNAGALPGSYLTTAVPTPNGVEAVVNLNPARHTKESVIERIPQLRAALGLRSPSPGDPGDGLLIDQPDGFLEDRVRIQVVRQSPLTPEVLAFTEPRFARPGTCYIGAYADGDGAAEWMLFDERGAHSGTIIGAPGGGKSYLMDVIALSARRAGATLGYIDPQDGVSSPSLADAASFVALGEANIEKAVAALEAIKTARQRWLKLHPAAGGKITATTTADCKPGCPCGGVVPPQMIVFIDECHVVFGRPGMAARFDDLARTVRKLGIGFVVATQVANLTAFGSNDALRSVIATQNLLAFHVRSNVGGNLIPGLPRNPRDIPKAPGYAVLGGSNSRDVELRTFFAPRDSDPQATTAPATIEQLFAAQPGNDLHWMDKQCVKAHLPDPERAAEIGWQEAAAYIAAMRGGQPIPAHDGAAASASGRVVNFPTAPVPGSQSAAPQQLELSSLPEHHRAVVEIMADGHTRTGDIVAAYGDPREHRDRVNRALRALQKAGWIRDGGHGTWLLTDAAARSRAQSEQAPAPGRPEMCGNCGATDGQPHGEGCSFARCLVTGQQRLQCEIFGGSPIAGALALASGGDQREFEDYFKADTGHDCGQDIYRSSRPGQLAG